MADENMTQDPNVQQSKKITVKLKPLALEKATGEQAAANVKVPAAPAGASASATVKFDRKTVAASEPEMPTAQDLAKQTIKLTPPPRTGLPKPPSPIPTAAPKKATQVVKPVAVEPAAAATPPLKKATQVVKPVETEPAAAATPTLKKATQVVKPVETESAAPAPAAVETPAAAATQAVKRPGLSLPQKPAAPAPAEQPAPAPAPAPAEQAAPAAEAPKKRGLSLPKKPAAPAPAEQPAPAAPAPAEQPAPAPAPAPAASDADAKRVQEEGLKPREGASGLGLKKVEKVAEEDLPDSLRQETSAPGTVHSGRIKLQGPADEPGPVFTAIVVLAFVILLIGVYVQFFSYAKWMPEMDAHINSLPAPPTGVLSK